MHGRHVSELGGEVDGQRGKLDVTVTSFCGVVCRVQRLGGLSMCTIETIITKALPCTLVGL